jgi:hypothetical protein
MTATYSELKSRAQKLLARTDLSSDVQEWVSAAEKHIVDRLRVREMQKINAAIPILAGALTLPADFIAVGELRLASNKRVYVTSAAEGALFDYEECAFGSGYGYWAIIGDQLLIRPSPADGEAYWMSYWAAPAALTETSQETNAIFPKYFDVYVAGTMWQAFKQVRNYEASDRYLAECDALIERYNQRHIEEIEGYSTLAVKPPQAA